MEYTELINFNVGNEQRFITIGNVTYLGEKDPVIGGMNWYALPDGAKDGAVLIWQSAVTPIEQKIKEVEAELRKDPETAKDLDSIEFIKYKVGIEPNCKFFKTLPKEERKVYHMNVEEYIKDYIARGNGISIQTRWYVSFRGTKLCLWVNKIAIKKLKEIVFFVAEYQGEID